MRASAHSYDRIDVEIDWEQNVAMHGESKN